MSRILIWSPNYAPELTGIPPLVTDVAEWLAARGHEVEVVTAVPNYPERRIRREYRGAVWRTEERRGIPVHRSWLRVRPNERFSDKVLYEASFAALSIPRAARAAGRADAVVCVVPSLAAAVALGALSRVLGAAGRRPRVVLWVQDLVLAAALSLGELGPMAARVLRVGRAAEGWAARSADAVVVCSPGFRPYLLGLGVEPARVVVVHNWVDVERIRAGTPSGTNGKLRLLYAGNLGYTQGFETLVEAARLAGPGIAVEIVGAGNADAHVRRLARGAENVAVRPPVPDEEYAALLARADAHAVIQRRVSAGANLPSKIASYFASGRPVVASIDEATPAADLLRASGGAVLTEPEDPDALAAALVRLRDDPALRRELGARGRAFAERRLAKEPALRRLEAAILG